MHWGVRVSIYDCFVVYTCVPSSAMHFVLIHRNATISERSARNFLHNYPLKLPFYM